MGTRHLTAVQLDGEYRIAQYGQWDGYPSGQGATVLGFLRTMDRDQFAGKLRATKWLTDEERRATYMEIGADPEAEFISMDLAKKRDAKYPELSRDTGADILSLVCNAEPGIKLVNSIDFAGDSLFCEWAYVLDLDANVLEVYRGFNHDTHTGQRFSDMPRQHPEYAGVVLVKSYPLDSLPTDDQLIADCDPPETEEDEAA